MTPEELSDGETAAAAKQKQLGRVEREEEIVKTGAARLKVSE